MAKAKTETTGSRHAPERGRRRTINPDEKMERVLHVARSLFVKKGYYGVSVPMIVEAAGVSTGAIYSYFPNKAALAKAIYDRTLEEFQTLFDERRQTATSPRETLRAFAQLVFDLTESDPEMMEYMMFMKHGEFLSGALPLCFTQPFRLLQETVEAGMARGEVRRMPLLIAGLSYSGIILRAVELRLLCVFDQPLTELAEQLEENAWNAIRA